MKDFRNLKEIPVEQISGDFIRQIDAMSKKQKYSFLFFFTIANVLFITSHKFGPPFYHIETVPFDQSTTVSNTRKFLLKIGNFNFLNEFITLDMILIRKHDTDDITDFVDASLTIKNKKGKRSEILYSDISKTHKVHFTKQSKVSDKIRLYNRGVADFVHLDTEIVLKFKSSLIEKEENSEYSGAFIFTYSSASHICIETLIRLIFFICGIIWLFYFNTLDYDKTSTPIQLKVMHFNIILIVFSSDPFYILSYFTESPLIPFLDSLFAILLVFSASSSTLIILDLPRIIQLNFSKSTLIRVSFPFIISGFIFFVNEYLNHYSEHIDANALMILSFLKFFGVAVCFSLLMVSAMLSKTQNVFEKVIVFYMIFFTSTIVFNFERDGSIGPLISSNHAIQIFTFASVATYIFFIAFLFKPVDPLDANDDIDENMNFTDNEENSYDVADPF